ncbi:hypothetical protein DPMN_180200 [Dreissena polymorpha]|uniref:Uncharacterized protein n=1 Tax=Dreissena polymorpha TaxID=45954 RepID=A0A9D4ILG4_DREPO|nr:hypothetical protein DPMN_180200 [Dreissena polymorpha]
MLLGLLWSTHHPIQLSDFCQRGRNGSSLEPERRRHILGGDRGVSDGLPCQTTKALLKSRRMRSIWRPVARLLTSWSVNSISCVLQERRSRKPC